MTEPNAIKVWKARRERMHRRAVAWSPKKHRPKAQPAPKGRRR